MLEDLRDIHLPEVVSWWPLAPGWWLILILLLSIPVLLWYLRRRRAQRILCADSLALAELEILRNNFSADQDINQLLAGLSVLLRRTAMTISPRQEVASLVGDTWLKWLDQQVDSVLFSDGPGRFIADAHYRPQTSEDNVDGEALLGVCEQWIKAVFHRK